MIKTEKTPRKIGFSGCHRTGKTTQAVALSELQGIPLVESCASKVFKNSKFRASKSLSLKDRLAIQDEILDIQHQKWLEVPEFISDRTPLDMIAYMLKEIQDTDVRIFLYDILGQKCRDILSGNYAKGHYRIPINARDLPSGAYVLHIQMGLSKQTQKIILSK